MQALSTKSPSPGFTIVEVVIAVVVLGVLSVIIIGPLGDFYSNILTTLGRTSQETDTRSTLRTIERELTNNVGFIGTYATQTPLGMNGSDSWNYRGDGVGKRVLIAQTYATDKASNDSARLPIFVKPSNGDCHSPADIAVVTEVYFIAPDTANTSQNNLYRRTMLPSTNSADYCDANGNSNVLPYQRQSCTTGCATSDAVLLRGITKMDIDYYSPTSLTIPSVLSTDTADKSDVVKAADRLKVTIQTDRINQGKNVTDTAYLWIDAGILTSLAAGSSDAGASTDSSTTDPSQGSILQYYGSDGTYTIPATANYIDIVLIGGGGGGQGGGTLNSAGHGGSSGSWNYTTLQRGVDIDTKVKQLSVSIGGGGTGGRGFATGFDYTLLGPENGTQGGSTTVNQVIPGGLDPTDLSVLWNGIVATGGGGGRGLPNNNDVPGFKAVPYNFYYLGRSYTAGPPGANAASDGTAPGGSGAGGKGAIGFVAGKAANGAPGGAWIRAY